MKKDQSNTESVNPRTGMDAESIKESYQNHLTYDLAVNNRLSTDHDKYLALAWAVRDRLIDRWMKTQDAFYDNYRKRVFYLSMEFLIGRSLGNNVINLQMEESIKDALKSLDLDWEDLRDEEVDAGLGNGGLGRLAACFLESMATMGIPCFGYSLRYEHGIFQQGFVNGFQMEKPDSWLRGGNPWEIARPDLYIPVHFGGYVDMVKKGRELKVDWVPAETIWGVPYDIPTVGYGGKTVETLRLWQSVSPDDFDFDEFNKGDYFGAVDQKILAENLTKVLYPNDMTPGGRELRFRQQYFFVACSLGDILRRFKSVNGDWNDLPNKAAVQLNDTHPTLAIPELMRYLMDEEGLTWDHAWGITTKSIAYTNHTLMPEALEKWSADMFERVLPRHWQIICEVNARFLRKVAAYYPGDKGRRERMSIIQEYPNREVRMANLAIVGSYSVNGVAALHSDLVKTQLVPDFAQMYPEKFNNKTNGVTPRRWLLKANQGLASLISEKIGDGWITGLSDLKKLEPYADDPEFRKRFRETKLQAKEVLAGFCKRHLDIDLNTNMIFDVQAKRIHTYKRQLLNALHIVHLYNKLHQGRLKNFTPTTFIFAGKAAPGFYLAKLIIKMINNMAAIINENPLVNKFINVHFLPNYRVSLAERLIPAADVSEQISMA
ncbi:MAG: glycogen/starch/alpha-glucan family phosphorylase, partial [Planctomycetes bacterium]|nr:glycogen/starch/alpha-glucan family phosphorylase [Planctomycetota bacterium]